MPRQDQTEPACQRLIDAMTDVTRTKGYHATRVEDV